MELGDDGSCLVWSGFAKIGDYIHTCDNRQDSEKRERINENLWYG